MSRNAVAFEVPEHDDDRRSKPGAFYFVYSSAYPRDDATQASRAASAVGIVHACPCGCGVRTMLFFRGRGMDGADEWDVRGDWPKVWLYPSIGIGTKPNYHWHGWMEDGVFVEK